MHNIRDELLVHEVTNYMMQYSSMSGLFCELG